MPEFPEAGLEPPKFANLMSSFEALFEMIISVGEFLVWSHPS